jgi:SOS-response transcriptional repressor LexA
VELKDRFKQSRIALGLTQWELATAIGVSQTAINKIEIGSTLKPRNIVELAEILKVSAHWLTTGEDQNKAIAQLDDMLAKQKIFNEHHNISNEHNTVVNLVPLISWVQAGAWSEVIDNFLPGDTDQYYPCPEKHSKSTFALTVVGESMYPDFIPGEIIYVDPEVEASSGSCVVVRQNGDLDATFKQLMFDGSKRYLKALNPSWPVPIIEMLPDAVICGVVIGSYRKRN